MKVEPELLDHPKFLKLKQALGDGAAELLLRLWGHCEASQRGEFWSGADAEYVEMVLRWSGETGKLFEVLRRLRWVDVSQNGIRVHDWNDKNWRAVTNWHTGRKGGRPLKDNPRVNRRDNPEDANGKTQCITPLKGGRDEGMNEGGEERAPEANTPGLAECVAWARDNGVDPEWTRLKWENTQGTHGWERRGRLIDWRRLWKVWFEEDVRLKRWRAGGVTEKNGGPNGRAPGGESVAQVIFRLDREIRELSEQIDANEEIDPELCDRLKARLKEAEGERARLS